MINEMKKFFRDIIIKWPAPFLAYPLYGVIGAGIIVYINSIFALSLGLEKGSLLYLLLKEFGFALIIATFLGFTVEIYNFQRHLELSKEIQEDVFKAIYGNKLSENLLSAIRQRLFYVDFVCVKCKVAIRLLPHAADNTKMILVVRSDHSIKNVSGRNNEIYSFKPYFFYEPSRHSPYESKFVNLRINGISQNIDSSLHNGDSSHGPSIETPISFGINETKIFSIDSELVMDHSDKFPYVLGRPTGELEISVDAPKEITVHIRALHSEAMTRETTDNPHFPTVWRLDAGLFPGNGVLISWNPI